MKSSSDLHQLIKSMSKSEKRFFKLSASIHAGDKNYLILFDAIEKQKVYDEEKIKTDLKNFSLARNLAYEKNYLFGQILRTLRNFHSGKNVDFQLSEMIENISLLHSRGLYKACEKLLHKAKEIALVHERNTALMDLLKWEWDLMHSVYAFDRIKTGLNTILTQYREATDRIHNLNKYKVVASRVFINTYQGIHIRGEEQQNMYKKLAALPVLKYESNALSYDAKAYFYLIKANLFFVQRDWKNAFKTTVKLLQFLESNPAKMNEEPRKYIIVLNNIFSACNALNKRDELFYYLEKIDAFSSQLPNNQSRGIKEEIFLYSNYARLEYYWVSGQFSQGIKTIELIKEQFLEIVKNPLYTNHDLLFKVLFAVLYFAEGQFNKAIQWLNQVINHEAKALREDVMSTAVLLNIILHYEYGNEDLLDYLVRSAYRYLYKKQRLYKFENIMLQFIRKELSKVDTKEKLLTALKALRKKLVSLEKDPYESKALERFDFITWIDSKLLNKSFKETVIKKQER